uniref:NADH-ubiquinone oxidoreductase chain 4L n=1 Tax=Prionospio sp. 2 MH-2023 TaxID=3059270 RepID=A0AAU6QGV1_9ANNE
MSISLLPPFTFITLFALLSFVMQRHHVLMCLLSLEATLLSLAFGITIMNASPTSMDMFYCVVILSFAACEAAVALAVLVVITRSFGSDLINSVNTNKC